MSDIDQTAIFALLYVYKHGDRCARNYFDRHTASGVIWGISKMESQSVVGLHAKRRSRPGVAHRGHPAAYGPDLVGQARLRLKAASHWRR
jgi:hypothetical protein